MLTMTCGAGAFYHPTFWGLSIAFEILVIQIAQPPQGGSKKDLSSKSMDTTDTLEAPGVTIAVNGTYAQPWLVERMPDVVYLLE
jgi:hypothetical protein